MADHLKQLFNRRLVYDAMRPFMGSISEEQRAFATEWARKVATNGLDGETEKTLQGLFLTRIFDRVLGYRQVVDGADIHYMKPEHALKAVKSGKTPDAALGFFGDDQNTIRAVVELKAPGADLDAKQGKGYGQITAVEQAFGYAAKLDGCRWVIVSNFNAIRLYRYGSGQISCHVFDLSDLVDEEKLEQLLYLLGRDTLLGDGETESSVDELAGRTHVEEERITKDFYSFYKNVRIQLFEQLVRDNPAQGIADQERHQVSLLEHTQKVLDRVLFICFCEDTGLLPPNIIRRALTADSDGFVNVSRWQQMQGLFDAVDSGHPAMNINAYNGGLFAKDSSLDALEVADDVLSGILELADYDFETDLNVNILGHIFEQSISDLEAIRAEIHGGTVERSASKRKKHGVFYTPDYITRFIVARTIGGWLDDRYAEIHAKHYPRGKRKSKDREIALYEDYFEILKAIKVVDPACGSGAFLIAAFDFLSGAYERVNRMLAELRGLSGQMGLFDLDRQILQQNLYGVDVNPESTEITKLSLWLKTARADKTLNNLDGNIKCGNSVIAPLDGDATSVANTAVGSLPEDSHPFDWQAAFPDVFESGGFDVVIGNPPYVRQESLSEFKPYLEQHYASYHGVADLYVYFYEKALQLLAPHGKVAYIVSNKWFKAGYGAPLRRFFAERAAFEEIIDFGHSPIFEDADTFPCIVVYRHVRKSESGTSVRVCPVPRDRDTELSLEQFVDEHAYPVPWSRYGENAWSLEPPAVDELMEKVRNRGVPLREYSGVRPLYGIKTGFNEAFLIDDATRMRVIQDDPSSEEVIKPYLRGQDIKRWVPEWAGLWMIVMKSSGNHVWPWSDAGDDAERVFAETYPSLYAHMKPREERLKRRTDKGLYWWELRSCDYYDMFEAPKIIHTDIAWRPQFAFMDTPIYSVNTTYCWPTQDLWVLAVMNAPITWAYMWRHAQHGKDEALRLFRTFMEELPIPRATDSARRDAEIAVKQLMDIFREAAISQREMLDWLYHEYNVEKPGDKLTDSAALTDAEFIAEIKKRRSKGSPKFKPSDIKALKEAHSEYSSPARVRRNRIAEQERLLSNLVNQAYGLTDADIALMLKTAPPRMPI